MLITVDLQEAYVADIRHIAQQNSIHESNVIQQAIAEWLNKHKAMVSEKQATPHPMRAYFGLWRDNPNIKDGLDYQNKLRDEWQD
ncbi:MULTISPECIES: hypothetical protein [unclassified Moraxella]|uniref:hypothetical protein n=1 Tax=unclassified Moraxella TaxID=2685852 RepID=UPI003AF7BCE6